MVDKQRVLGIGIDGGSVNLGVAVMSFSPPALLWHYEANMKKSMDLDARLLYLTVWLNSNFKGIAEQSRTVGEIAFVGLEDAFSARNVATSLVLGRMIGICTAMSILRFGRVPVIVSPSSGKRALTGSGNASKEDMQRSVMVQFFGGRPDHVPADYGITEHWADAVGICLATYSKESVERGFR